MFFLFCLIFCTIWQIPRMRSKPANERADIWILLTHFELGGVLRHLAIIFVFSRNGYTEAPFGGFVCKYNAYIDYNFYCLIYIILFLLSNFRNEEIFYNEMLLRREETRWPCVLMLISLRLSLLLNLFWMMVEMDPNGVQSTT